MVKPLSSILLVSSVSFFTATTAWAFGSAPHAAIPSATERSIALAQPLFFKAEGREFGKPVLRYGLAERLVPMYILNARSQRPLPTDYSLAHRYSDNKPIYTSELSRVVFDSKASTAKFVMKEGAEKVISPMYLGVGLPDDVCTRGLAKVTFESCARVDLFGELLDFNSVKSFTGMFKRQSYESIEFIEGPEAVIAFNKVKAQFVQLQKAEQVAIATEMQADKAWRSGLKEGSMTNCGMIIERKKDIAHIQMNNGTRWMPLASLAQPSSGNRCD